MQAVHISTFSSFSQQGTSIKAILRHVMFAFRMIALALLITALARPQSSTSWQDVTTEVLTLSYQWIYLGVC